MCSGNTVELENFAIGPKMDDQEVNSKELEETSVQPEPSLVLNMGTEDPESDGVCFVLRLCINTICSVFNLSRKHQLFGMR